jgi:hypothetical protein
MKSFRLSPRARGAKRRRTKRARMAVLAVMAAGIAVAAAIGVSAAVPAFPDNLLIFPNRDFISVAGFQDHAGDTATVEVRRGGALIGSTTAVVSGGDVAFEVNHPGGVCWGNGTSLQVTPDIQPGDVVAIKFGSTVAADTTVLDAGFVDAVADTSLSGSTLTVKGHLGTVNRPDPASMEQRIVNPDLVALVGKRDVRALPGPLTPAATGGYSSSLEITGDIFTATYVFDDAQAAQTAASGGGERLLSWQVTDAAGNRQGVSIAEAGEPGGPGMGGCPLRPADQAAPQPGTASAVRSADKTQLVINWTPAVPQPGAAAVTGYSVEAIAATATTLGDQVEHGTRTTASATRTTISGLDPSEAYSLELRSLAGPRMSDAFTVAIPAPTPPPPGGDLVVPIVTATPAAVAAPGITQATSVTLSSETGASIFFTTDGSPALFGDLPSDSATLYTGPVAITQQTELHWVVFDQAGNFAAGYGLYAPPTALPAPPAAPSFVRSTAGQETLTLNWESTDPSITGYGVQLYDFTTGTVVGALRETAAKTLTINGVTPGDYSFTVKAKNAGGYGPESTRSAKLTVTRITDQVTITQATWKAGDFRVVGTDSAVGAIVTIRAGSPTGTVLGQAAVTAAAPPAVGGDFTLRLRNGAAPAQKPATIYAVSNNGGIAGPFTVR